MSALAYMCNPVVAHISCTNSCIYIPCIYVLLLFCILTEALALPLLRALQVEWVMSHEQLAEDRSSSEPKAILNDGIKLTERLMFIVICNNKDLQTLLVQVR